MESNAAVTLQLEHPAVTNSLFFFKCVHLFAKILKLFYLLLFIDAIFFLFLLFLFLNILKTKCNSVRERAFFQPFLHTGTHGLQQI